MLPESGHIPYQGSRVPLMDKEAMGYMDLEVSGDKESVVEDDNTEPDEGDTVGACEEGNVDGTLEAGNVVEVLEEGDTVEVLKEMRDQAA